MAVLEAVKPILPFPGLVVVCFALHWFFKKTWRDLDEESYQLRSEARERGEPWDARPLVALVTVAAVLMVQEYYGTRAYYEFTVKPLLVKLADARISPERPDPFGLVKYQELYGHAFWALTRCGGYVAPLLVWPIAFRKDSILDMGLRTGGFFKHAKLYGLFLAVVAIAMVVVSRAPDFGTYYPFYKLSSRSWWDLLLWELMYFAQFFTLEFFFRGFLLSVLRRSMGSAAIFVMAVPYCMIHFGKPYLEVGGAIVAGIALGSLSMKTKSIYQGFLLHISIALSMDVLALSHRDALPSAFWP